jgi:hypothetical protein
MSDLNKRKDIKTCNCGKNIDYSSLADDDPIVCECGEEYVCIEWYVKGKLNHRGLDLDV